MPSSMGIFPTGRSNPGLPYCRQILYYLSHQGIPNTLGPMGHSAKNIEGAPRGIGQGLAVACLQLPTGSQDPTKIFLTEVAIGAGIMTAGGTRLALQWILDKAFKVESIQPQGLERVCIFFSITVFPGQEWVICSPAAFLRYGS